MSINKKYYVIFLDDVQEHLATWAREAPSRLTIANKEFDNWATAKRYADTIATSRCPQVVHGFGGGFPNIKKVSSND